MTQLILDALESATQLAKFTRIGDREFQALVSAALVGFAARRDRARRGIES